MEEAATAARADMGALRDHEVREAGSAAGGDKDVAAAAAAANVIDGRGGLRGGGGGKAGRARGVSAGIVAGASGFSAGVVAGAAVLIIRGLAFVGIGWGDRGVSRVLRGSDAGLPVDVVDFPCL